MKTVEMNYNSVVKHAIVAPDEWGSVIQGGMVMEHISVTLLRVPEGSINVTVCTECGAKVESLIDYRPAYREWDENGREEVSEADVEHTAVGRQGREALARIHESGWLQRHQQCDYNPENHLIEGRIREIIDEMEAWARNLIEQGERVDSQIHLFFIDETSPDRKFISVVIPLFDVGNVFGRTQEIVARYSAVRDVIRANDLNLLFAVHLSEAWAGGVSDVSPEDIQGLAGGTIRKELHEEAMKNREEIVTMTCITNDFMKFAYAPIERATGVAGDAVPGILGDFDWESAQSASGLAVQGLFATTLQPLPEDIAEENRQGDFGG